ncbi:hypothetical protein THMIRHAM_19300 [Thiomicrorhabdus immobilis]|uniref:ATP-binding cassette domain-containing protein n=1 Tax=Thiomicrorhabdus immobilis TaxID=2791037 RepID=A0ABN6CYS5_9GAMM|nr:ATP-binding cassette domain-containing protein [Thiomicrorhabdus immobilis]BCN94145.1 hypothetical protein THMIRHAM_19300 [Thiomicrorhabdus immobilis]
MNWMFKLFSRSPWIASEILISSFFINFLGLASAVFVIQVYGRYLVHGIDGTLITLASGMLFVIVIELLFRRLRYRMGMKLVAERDRVESEAVFDTLLNARFESLMNMKPGIRQMFLNRNEQLQQSLNPSLFISWVDVPFALLYLIAIYLISTFIGHAVLFVLLVTVIISVWIGLELRSLTQEQMHSQASQSDVYASLDRFEMVRSTAVAPYLKSQWNANSTTSRWWKYLSGKEQDFLQTINQSMVLLMTVVVISLGAREVIQGNIDFGMLIGMNILAARAMMLLTRPTQSIAVLLRAQELQKMLEPLKEIPQEQQKGSKPNQFTHRIEIKDVSFAYEMGTGPVFENLSVKIPPGAFVKVIGNNGMGKTTLSRLLVSLLQPQRGMILVDGMDIRQFNSLWWRKQLIYLPQEPEFMNDSLKNNLIALNPDIEEEKLKQIILRIGLNDFVDRHPDGIDLMIKDGGRSLPLGIKRRLALARAMVSEGSIVIIDEPTEGLDRDGVTAMEKLLQLFLQQEKTVIVMSGDFNAIKVKGITIDLNQKPTPKVIAPVSVKGIL